MQQLCISWREFGHTDLPVECQLVSQREKPIEIKRRIAIALSSQSISDGYDLTIDRIPFYETVRTLLFRR